MNKENYKVLLETRKRFNEMIMEDLQKYLQDNPDMRFGQALYNLWLSKYDHIDCSTIHNEESSKIFDLMSIE